MSQKVPQFGDIKRRAHEAMDSYSHLWRRL